MATTLRTFGDLDASTPAPAVASLAEDEEGDVVAADPPPGSGVMVRSPLHLNRTLFKKVRWARLCNGIAPVA